jgi:DNA-binding transcriptional LysR family regulator
LRHNLLASGRFLAVIPGSVLRFGQQRTMFKVLPIELPRWRLPIAIITLKDRTISPVAQLFLDCVRNLAKGLAKDVGA